MTQQTKWIDINFTQYKRCTVTSYTGGSTWLRSPDFPDTWLVVHGSGPLEIRRWFINNPPDYKLTVERVNASVLM